MDTIVAKITNDSLTDKKIYEQAGKILREGGLVAFPTETVYGLGADALDEEASAKIYAARHQKKHALPVFLSLSGMPWRDLLQSKMQL